ncbi:hypothetical protein K8T06_04095 [bacterium]|nr:hypothetical protein [bacterium]
MNVRLACVVSILMILVPSMYAGYPKGFTNFRSAAFGGAGVAVTPTRNMTPLQVNPAAPAFLEEGIRANGGILLGVLHPDSGDDIFDVTLMGEFYSGFDAFTIFGSGLFEFKYRDSSSLATCLIGAGGASSFLDDMIAVGGRIDLWAAASQSDRDNYNSDSETMGPGFTFGIGVLYVSPVGVNLDFACYSYVDDDGFRIPDELKLGAVYQPAGST